MGKISIFTLGHTGVVLDPNSQDPNVPQNALAKAQNAGPDPRQGRGGAIRKRPGLARFNIAYAGGVILGGIPMPVAEFGGAPSSGGGASVGTGDTTDGTSTGTGDMTGAPGGTFDGGPIATTPPGAGIFGGGSLFGGVRLIVVARSTTGRSDGGLGWYVGPKGLTSNAIQTTLPAQASVYAYPPTPEFGYNFGLPGCVDNIGTTGLYYAGNIGDQIVGFTAPTVYRTDGGTNVLLATVPRSIRADATINGGPAAITAIRNAIMNMHYGSDGYIYICVKDKYTGQSTAGSCGRVFRLTPSTGAIVEWNMGSTTPGVPELFAHLPYVSCFFDGKLYVGTFPDAINESAQVWATNGSLAVQETAFTGPGTHNYGYIASMCVYNGRLFVGTGEWATVPQLLQVWSRRPGDSTGAWFMSLQQSTGIAANGSTFLSMIVFQGSLYVSFIGTVGTIYKITANNPGDPTSTSFTTSVVLTGLIYAPLLWVDDGILYAISTGDDAGAPPVQITTDGTTWVDKAGTLPVTGASHARGIFFGLDQ